MDEKWYKVLPEWQKLTIAINAVKFAESFYADPENERRYQEWLKTRHTANATA